MGARRDDISGQQRMQLALAVLVPHRPYGTVSRLAHDVGLSRQTLYTIAAAAARVLSTALAPRPHGPQLPASTIQVDRNRLLRASVVLTEVGVSQRDVAFCLAEVLDTPVSVGWLHAALARVEHAAAAQNAAWQPTCEETLSGDELFSQGAPNLLVVGNDSLYIYALSRQPRCDGDTGGCILLDSPPTPLFNSDAGSGLAAGVQAAGMAVHQGDWDHVLRPLWGQVARLEAHAYAALEAAEERVIKFDQAHTTGRLAQHLRAWERLEREAQRAVARHDTFRSLAEQVDSWFALIDWETGELRDPVTGAAALRAIGHQIQALPGGNIYDNVGKLLIHQAEALFRYQPVLAQALQPLVARWGAPTIQALARIWQLDADARRHPGPLADQQHRQRSWLASLDAAVALVGPEQVWEAWAAVCAVLGHAWRGSMLAECVNSLLRPILDRRKATDQGCLELFRFRHNVRRFTRGKRAGTSPAELVGIELPDDPLTLLGLTPKCQSNSPEF
jgi:hypothetical protein